MSKHMTFCSNHFMGDWLTRKALTRAVVARIMNPVLITEKAMFLFAL